MFVDSHCHLDRLKLDQCGGSLEAALASARADGVKHMLCVCISPENRQVVLDIACGDRQIYASAGVHPSDVQPEVISVETLQQWCDHPKVVALGETGLDYHYAADRKEQQRQSFINHLVAGKNLGLPVIVHSREARDDTLELIRDHGCRTAAGVLHCFTESWEMARAALDMNYYISISGIVTFRNADELRDVAKKIPADRLLIETDSPYLAPIPYRGKPNQPRYVRAVAEFLAELRGVAVEELAEYTTANFFRLFPRAA
jgi:TatD DNase family protein